MSKIAPLLRDSRCRAAAESHGIDGVADVFLVAGSSLVVYPAAGFPAFAKESGAALVIVNREPTDLDDLADLVINAEIGPTLDAAVNGSN